jgi:hypothetical protein
LPIPTCSGPVRTSAYRGAQAGKGDRHKQTKAQAYKRTHSERERERKTPAHTGVRAPIHGRTLSPGWNVVPRWRTMILPGITASPPNFFTPRRRPAESRPFLVDPPLFFVAVRCGTSTAAAAPSLTRAQKIGAATARSIAAILRIGPRGAPPHGVDPSTAAERRRLGRSGAARDVGVGGDGAASRTTRVCGWRGRQWPRRRRVVRYLPSPSSLPYHNTHTHTHARTHNCSAASLSCRWAPQADCGAPPPAGVERGCRSAPVRARATGRALRGRHALSGAVATAPGPSPSAAAATARPGGP